jgi:hypothetical protein
MSRRAKWTLGISIVVGALGGRFALSAGKRGNLSTNRKKT